MADSDKHSIIHPKNLVNGLSRLLSGDVDDTKANVQGELLWLGVLGYVVGNSIGTANTGKGARRLNLGPVYIW